VENRSGTILLALPERCVLRHILDPCIVSALTTSSGRASGCLPATATAWRALSRRDWHNLSTS